MKREFVSAFSINIDVYTMANDETEAAKIAEDLLKSRYISVEVNVFSVRHLATSSIDDQTYQE